MNPIDRIHGDYVFNRRVRVLSGHLAEAIPKDASVLDVGCGDGAMAMAIASGRPDLKIEGIDVLVREKTHIPVAGFDGSRIPREDNSVDVALFVDVLHHTEDPMVLLREAKRVAQKAIVIKDHTRNGFLAGATLRFMDWVGNARHGVALPYNYWPENRWREAFEELGFEVEMWRSKLGLYPPPAGWAFDRSLHFVARLACGGGCADIPARETKVRSETSGRGCPRSEVEASVREDAGESRTGT